MKWVSLKTIARNNKNPLCVLIVACRLICIDKNERLESWKPIKLFCISACNRTYYGDIGKTYDLDLHRPREDKLPYICHLTFTASGGNFGDIVQVCCCFLFSSPRWYIFLDYCRLWPILKHTGNLHFANCIYLNLYTGNFCKSRHSINTSCNWCSLCKLRGIKTHELSITW